MLTYRAQTLECRIGLGQFSESSFYGLDHGRQRGKVAVVQTQPAGQFPYPLDRVEVGAVRRQERQAKVGLLLLPPLSVQGGVMVFGVIYDHYHAPPIAAAGLAHLPEKRPSGLRIERLGFLREEELPITNPHRAEISHTFARRMMQQHRVLDFRRDPHSAARTVLLEMHLIHGPQINRLVVYERVQFFYKRSVAADPLRLRRGEVFAAGNSTGGTGADTAALPNSRLTAGVEMQPRF